MRTEFKSLPITVPAGQPDLDMGVIDLRSTKWAAMIGRPAPEIEPMRAWRNGAPVTLANLRGQVVWLRFGAGQSLLAGDATELVKLHEAFGNKGLTIVMISSNNSLEDLEYQWSNTDPRFSNVREVPFRIAIHGDTAADREGTGPRRIGATFERYGIAGYPTDILIDRAGNMMGRPDLRHAREAISQMLGVPPDINN